MNRLVRQLHSYTTRQWRHDFFWLTYAELRNRGLVHFIGDSHARVYRYEPGMISHVIAAATAYNLVKEYSTTKSRQQVFQELKWVDPKRDIVVLVFGEVDCRFHINHQYVKTGVSMDDLIDRTVINYGKVIREVQGMGYRTYLCNVAPAGWRENKEFPYYGDPYTRAWITKTFNERLRNFGPDMIDVYTPSADSEGFITSNFDLDQVHLNHNIVSYVKKQIAQKFPTWVMNHAL